MQSLGLGGGGGALKMAAGARLRSDDEGAVVDITCGHFWNGLWQGLDLHKVLVSLANYRELQKLNNRSYFVEDLLEP